MKKLNKKQILTEEQQARVRFAVVASGKEMADGTSQTIDLIKVRLRDASEVYVRDLDRIDPENPQPNGDYVVSLVNDHAGRVSEQSGGGWLFVDAGVLKMAFLIADNDAGRAVTPLFDDGLVQLSTEGYLEAIDDNGGYGDYVVYSVSPVTIGNDPATQVENGAEMTLKDVRKRLADIEAELAEMEASEEVVEESVEENAGETITDPVAREEEKDEEPEEQKEEKPKKKGKNMNNVTQFVGVETEYLKTNAAMNDFVEALKVGAGSATATKAAWENKLTENGISFTPEGLSVLPETLVNEINEVITTKGEILNKLNNTGLDYFTVAIAHPLESAKVRARGASTAKDSQSVASVARVLQPTAFYKLFSVSYDMIARNGGLNGAIAQFASRELAMKVVELIERAVVIGGVVDDATNAISPQFVTPISADTTTGGAFGDTYTTLVGESVAEGLTKSAAMIKTGGAVTLITTPENAASLPYMTIGNMPMFMTSGDRGQIQIPMVSEVLAPHWLTSVDLNGAFGYLVDLNAYYTVGDASTQSFYDFYMRTNEHDFEAIKMFGGALAKPKSAVKLTIATETGA